MAERRVLLPSPSTLEEPDRPKHPKAGTNPFTLSIQLAMRAGWLELVPTVAQFAFAEALGFDPRSAVRRIFAVKAKR
jgi:hypothetical protein